MSRQITWSPDRVPANLDSSERNYRSQSSASIILSLVLVLYRLIMERSAHKRSPRRGLSRLATNACQISPRTFICPDLFRDLLIVMRNAEIHLPLRAYSDGLLAAVIGTLPGEP